MTTNTAITDNAEVAFRLCQQLRGTNDEPQRRRIIRELIGSVVWPLIAGPQWGVGICRAAAGRLAPDDARSAAAEAVARFVTRDLTPDLETRIGIGVLHAVAMTGVARDASASIGGVPDSTWSGRRVRARAVARVREDVWHIIGRREHREPTQQEVLNAANAVLRRRDGRASLSDLVDPRDLYVTRDDLADTIVDPAADPLDLMVRREERSEAALLLASVPAEDLWLLRQHFERGRTTADIGAELGVDQSTIVRRLQKARLRLAAHRDALGSYDLAA
jgi:DNA-directed RNA polymerase specialized sigma24 family protein